MFPLIVADTEKGIYGLQRQLETRDRELADERSKRKVLQKHFEKKTEKRLMNDFAANRHRVTASNPPPSQLHPPLKGAYF